MLLIDTVMRLLAQRAFNSMGLTLSRHPFLFFPFVNLVVHGCDDRSLCWVSYPPCKPLPASLWVSTESHFLLVMFLNFFMVLLWFSQRHAPHLTRLSTKYNNC